MIRLQRACRVPGVASSLFPSYRLCIYGSDSHTSQLLLYHAVPTSSAHSAHPDNSHGVHVDAHVYLPPGAGEVSISVLRPSSEAIRALLSFPCPSLRDVRRNPLAVRSCNIFIHVRPALRGHKAESDMPICPTSSPRFAPEGSRRLLWTSTTSKFAFQPQPGERARCRRSQASRMSPVAYRGCGGNTHAAFSVDAYPCGMQPCA